MRVELDLKFSKKLAVIVGAFFGLVVLVAATYYVLSNTGNPLPAQIKTQITYRAIYPSKTSQIDPASYNYKADQKALTFNLSVAGTTVVFTEQPAPDSLAASGQVYYPALGLHPYAQFQTKLGPVALTKFWQSGNLQPVGQSAILASNGTLLVAHSEQELTNAQWKDLFDSLKITK